jgi:hypothetical protein
MTEFWVVWARMLGEIIEWACDSAREFLRITK